MTRPADAARAALLASLSALFCVQLAPALAAQCSPLELGSPQPADDDWFGHDVAWDGEWLFVSSPGCDAGGLLGGAVDVFRVTAQGAQHVQRLYPSNQTNYMLFGWSLDADAGRLVVSAPYVWGVIENAGSGPPPPGVVYVFERFGGAWLETQLITPANGASRDEFGLTLALSGARLLVGAPYNDLAHMNGGRVYAYDHTGAGFTLSQELAPTPLQGGMGAALALDGDLCVVRAGTQLFTQTVTLYRRVGTQWVYHRPFGLANSAYMNDWGMDLDLDGTRLAISGPAYAPTDGAVFYYEDATSLTAQPEIVPRASIVGIREFGRQVSLAGDTLYAVDSPRAVAGFQAYVRRFERGPAGWVEVEAFTQAAGGHYDGYGAEIATAGPRVAVGASRREVAGQAVGEVWLDFRDPALARTCFCDLAAPCGALALDGGCVNSTGQSARLFGCGTASVSADDLTLRAMGLPGLQFVLPFMGDLLEPAQVLGGGRRCAGGVAKRFAPVLVGASGEVSVGPHLASLSQALHGAAGIAAGRTWSFQLWYRDNAQACSNVNLTNALTVQFSP